MAMQFLNSLRAVKVKDVPQHIKPLLSREKAKKAVEDFLEDYKRKYIYTGSIKPLHHVLIGVGVFSYLVALPHERRHLAHLEEEAKHGKGHGH
ncbi:hypothetical protein KP509_33G050000 [Ceratopteris richardii]|uniref:Uncharacterized protein n=1 Tax=Ceratopteris richardii TaxID=49495 RepID=A0A8T2QQX5_CERRI|nr:hypothetical protein KP509_33G050000 [Ceratopteris richardii]KAH7285885.1 hypothetical protein KP509_33G050000 [Ceratopteris richardii]